MSSTGIDWQQFLSVVINHVPILIAWCIAIVFCFLRRRENPKGTVYLGLAILVQISGSVLWYFLIILNGSYVSTGSSFLSLFSSYAFYIAIAVNTVTFVASWILISMAVFSAPKHSDYVVGRSS